MSDLSPDEYESLTGIAKAEYEARVLAGARNAALEYYPEGSTRQPVSEVREITDAPMCCQGASDVAGRPVMGHSGEGELL